MNTEIQLIQAATAAGYQIDSLGYKFNTRTKIVTNLFITNDKHDNFNVHWNPLEDDGDAIRLAADLQFNIQIGSLDGTVIVTCNNDNRVYVSQICEPGESYYKAMRIAIVKAACMVHQLQGKNNGW